MSERKRVTCSLVIIVPPPDDRPSHFRAAFAQALRDAIQRARAKRRIDAAQAEELWRVVPDPEHA